MNLLRAQLGRVRRVFVEVEAVTVGLHDPDAIELAVIASLAMRLLDQRLGELDLVAEVEREVYGDVDELAV